MLEKTKIPGTRLLVSKLCLGTNMFGTALDQAATNAVLNAFVERGGNFIDTARMYGDWVPDAPTGASERAIGAWLKTRKRDSTVIATKGGGIDLKAGDWKPRVTPALIEKDLGESLSHLGISDVDLYWLHGDDPAQPVKPILDVLIANQKAGYINAFGASNWSPARIAEAQSYAQSVKHPGFVAIQPFWGLAVPNPEAAQMQGYWPYYEDGYRALHEAGMPVIPYSGQCRGYFTKLSQGGEAALPDALKAIYTNDGNERRLKVVLDLAAKHQVSVNQIVLAYLLCQPNFTVPIVGAARPEQLDDTVAATTVALTSEELALLRSGG
jgi:aryl-alcohol dehydrogenase-like predicted oxidoreductase